MSTPPITQEKSNDRRKLVARLGLLALFPLLASRFFKSGKKDVIACAPEPKTGVARFLTQDGKLVEVDIAEIKSDHKKISNQDILTWVKK
jgi:hypothetical protein